MAQCLNAWIARLVVTGYLSRLPELTEPPQERGIAQKTALFSNKKGVGSAVIAKAVTLKRIEPKFLSGC